MITGMTRDGVYMIEDGKLVYPVKNLRFVQPYVTALNNVEDISARNSSAAQRYVQFLHFLPCSSSQDKRLQIHQYYRVTAAICEAKLPAVCSAPHLLDKS